MQLTLVPWLQDVGRTIAAAGGRALLVGGAVRDRLRNVAPKDLDIEVFHLTPAALIDVLAKFGPTKVMGKSFPVYQVRGLSVDFTLPRALTFADAARYRDLTINSMGIDLVTGRLEDPHGGQADLAARRLRATDRRTFGADPVRGLRVAALAARLDMRPDAELMQLCSVLNLAHIAVERQFDALCQLLCLARQPSLGLEVLRHTGLLHFFPQLHAMVGVPQDPQWHPEGDVWTHTCLVVDAAAQLRATTPNRRLLMLAALLHDVGKPATTATVEGRVRAYNHDVAGVGPAQEFLRHLKAPQALIHQVGVLVRHHLAVAMLHANDASARAYRRLYRALDAAHIDVRTLHHLSRADHLGRTSDVAPCGQHPAGDAFWRQMTHLGLTERYVVDVVQGRHLIAAGQTPGPGFATLLRACREIQDATGWQSPERIVAQALLRTVPTSPTEPVRVPPKHN